MVDFWKWEYDYGHNLDPNAAIKVPGMAYQPPLIGFKQLLNFGAFSVPDIGGWLFIAAGVLVLIAVWTESKFSARFKKNKAAAGITSVLATALLFASCGNKGPEPIQLHKDACTSCKMSISEGNFAAELITPKGRVYKFDDVLCMNGYIKVNKGTEAGKFYVGDYQKENELIDATTAWFVRSEHIRSPMGGNTAAFADKAAAEKLADEYQTIIKNWDEINALLSSGNEYEHLH